MTIQKETVPQAKQAMAPIAPIVTEPKAPPVKPLEQRRLKLVVSSASDMSNQWAAVVPSGVTIDMVLEPSFWSNVASQIRVADLVDVHTDDRSYFAKLYVVDVARTRIAVSKLLHVELDAPAESTEPRAYRVKYSGPHTKWVVERVSDGRTVKEGCETKEAAESAMRAHEQAEARKAA
jgi:hypothetical protein